MLQYYGSLKTLQERKCVCKCYRTESTRVAVLSMLLSFAVALKIVAGVTEFSKCCERAGFFQGVAI